MKYFANYSGRFHTTNLNLPDKVKTMDNDFDGSLSIVFNVIGAVEIRHMNKPAEIQKCFSFHPFPSKYFIQISVKNIPLNSNMSQD